MEYEKIIFFRNFFFRAFIIGLAVGLFYFIATYVFWGTWASWATHFFKTDEKELGRLVLMFFVELRLVLVFLFSCASSSLALDGQKDAVTDQLRIA